eukprot:1156356-Pelagomonas_calceolata.AAC.1
MACYGSPLRYATIVSQERATLFVTFKECIKQIRECAKQVKSANNTSNVLVTARRAIENNYTSRSQVMEPGASNNPPDPH